MENTYRIIREAIQGDARDVMVQPCFGKAEAMCYLDLTVKKPFTVMRVREYFADQIVSLCVRTGEWSFVPIRFRARRIDPMAHTFRVHLELAEEWRKDDGRLLEALFSFAGEEAGKRDAEEARAVGSALWCMYVIGICIHDADRTAVLCGDGDRYVCFPNQEYVPYTVTVGDDDDCELVLNQVPMLESILEIQDGLEAHTTSLGEIPETSTIDAIASVTSEDSGSIDEDIDRLLAAADDAFSDPTPTRPRAETAHATA